MTNSRAIDARTLKTLILAVFFLSGISALIYQVVWMRMLTLTFGTTVFAVSTVVTVFMAGLGFGSYYFGHWVDKKSESLNLLKLYALLEVGIGLYCFFTPWLFAHIDLIYGYIYQLADINFYLFSFIRFFFSLLILIIPTVLMGATLPVLSKYLVTHKEGVGKNVGMLYGLNTFGAVIGVSLTAFVLIPFWGVKESLFTAVFLNFLIAAGVYYAARRAAEDKAGPAPAISRKEKRRKHKAEGKALPAYVYRLVLIAFAVSGFASLAYEVAWFRILSMTIGNSVYAFAVMLGTFLFGIALGSYLLSFYSDRIKDRLAAFGFMEIAIGVSVIALIPLFGQLPLAFMELVMQFGLDFWALQTVNFLTAFLVILVPTLIMGMTFPLAVRLLTEDVQRIGGNIGVLYAGNTLGGVAGSFLAGFFFIPFFGVQTTVAALAALNIGIGVLLIFNTPHLSLFLKKGVMVVGLILALGAFLLPTWDRSLLMSGPYFKAEHYVEPYQKGVLAETLKQSSQILYYQEGITGTVAVVQRRGNLHLLVNGKGIADARSDIFGHTLLGGLPMMLHPRPESALLVGLGSGVTLGAMERFPLREIEAVEISPGVVEASRYFSRHNYNALEDPRLKLVVDDGRIHLANSSKRYDVIVSQPSVPWMGSAANLYTREFYEAARNHLTEEGIISQWIQAYNMAPEDLKTLLRTFQEVFPHTSLWTYKVGNIFLLGSMQPLQVPYERIDERFNAPDIEGLMARVGVDSLERFLGGFTLDERALAHFVGDAPLNTDYKPIIEFSAPRNFFSPTRLGNYNEMAEFAPFARPPLTELVVEKDGYEWLPLLKLESYLGDEWHLVDAALKIKNAPIDTNVRGRPYVGKGVMKFVEWQVPGFQQEDIGRLRIRVAEQGLKAMSQSELWDRLSRTEKGQRLDAGRTTLSNQPFVWSITEGQEKRVMQLTWHCPENGLRYLGKMSLPSTGEVEVGRYIDDITAGFRCAS